MPNYAKRVDVQIPQLNDEGEVTEVKDKEQKKRRKSKVCWMLHVSVWGGGRTARGRQLSEFGIASFFPTPAFGLPHPEQFIGTRACSAPSHMGGSLGGIPRLQPHPHVSPVMAQSWGQGPSSLKIKSADLRDSIYATEHGLGTTWAKQGLAALGFSLLWAHA